MTFLPRPIHMVVTTVTFWEKHDLLMMGFPSIHVVVRGLWVFCVGFRVPGVPLNVPLGSQILWANVLAGSACLAGHREG